MQSVSLLQELLDAETEESALLALQKRSLLANELNWRYVGDLPNNESIVLAQQSSPVAALVEKYTNALDAILLRCCKAKGIDPRSPGAPQSMADAIEKFFGDLDAKSSDNLRDLADRYLVLYATGSKERPSLSLYDAGEGQLPENFPGTFCSLIADKQTKQSYKGNVPFVQGRFNMGGTGVLQYCGGRKMQLIVSRVPEDVAGAKSHEWGFTVMCYFPGDKGQNPSWKYLVDEAGNTFTAGTSPLALVPRGGAVRDVPTPRERKVASGTLIKMYDYEAPRSNICGELARKLEDYLLQPGLPLRIIECRDQYKANVMGVLAWDIMSRWAKAKRIEVGFEEGASFEVTLASGETVPGEIRVFKTDRPNSEQDVPHTGLRCMINGQSHGKRDARFFSSKAVDKEHIASSLLVTLACERLSQTTKNHLFMSNRETLRETAELSDLLSKVQGELRDHEALVALNQKRYAEKVKDAIKDEDGIKALEELLATDPQLANMFGSLVKGRAAALTSAGGAAGTIPGEPTPFKGKDFPTFFHRGKEMSQVADVKLQKGDVVRVAFLTDVKNNYFTRRRPPTGSVTFEGTLPEPSFRLFDGRLTFTCRAEKSAAIDSVLTTTATITDKKGSGPFVLTLNVCVVEAREPKERNGRKPKDPRIPSGPSQPNIKEQELGPDQPPVKLEKEPKTDRLVIILNSTSRLLSEAKELRSKEEEPAVTFVFKYGLALAVMGLLDRMKQTEDWKTDEQRCRERVQEMAEGIARVIVPLCLSLPKNLPKQGKQRSRTRLV